MNTTLHDGGRLRDKAKLVISVNHYASAFALVFAGICFFLLNIKGIVPLALAIYALANFANTLAYQNHKNLLLTYNISSVMATAFGLIITLASGGIQSPFIFVLGVVVFAGFVNTRVYGRSYLFINIILVSLVFLHDIGDFNLIVNTVPTESKLWFAYLSVLISFFLLGGVFGKNLLQAHHNLYKSRKEIESRIQEKEMLLKEVHHRVKNNLQTVSSLLNMQSRTVEDQKIRTLIKSSQNRVVSMAIVHEMLYQRDQYLSKIAVKPYVQELSEYLKRSLKRDASKIQLTIAIPELVLGIDTVIPLGLIINEAVTNALKYAFPDDRDGEITITIQKNKSENYTLTIEDNGVGFSENLNPKDLNSLGLKLIYNLTRQLKGNISRTALNGTGTKYVIVFEEVIDSMPQA
ncbi:hypothetical protein GCM10011414_18830 [Croceivirga lutea]|uniref:sensor histidine kinase n=1 Tax=Croceivirga lutea TaxID=1775167 RepID=UPI00163A2FC3|nr:sensor histidine kinase [Croceivirga lutea]GGG49237.1 hypothetical protein GCM10011414_18830 [Croceivirga lutea]